MTAYIVTIFFDVAIYTILVIAFNLTSGYLGYLNFAVAALFGAGAYLAALWDTVLLRDFALILPVSIVLGAVLGMLVALPTSRTRGVYFLITTVGIQSAFTELLKNTRWFGGVSGLSGIPRPNLFGIAMVTEVRMLMVALLILALTAIVYHRVTHSPIGRLMVAARNSEAALTGLRKRVYRLKVETFMISGAMSAAAGCLYAFQSRAVSPSECDVSTSLGIAVMAIVGGLGRFHAPLLGVVAVLGMNEVLRSVTLPIPINEFALRRILYAVLLIALVTAKSQGLAGLLDRMILKLRRQPA